MSSACDGAAMLTINVAECEPDEVIERGVFRRAYFDLTERLGASVIGATVFEIRAGDTFGPFHYHHGVEEWMYVVSGAPTLRHPGGERSLRPGELVAFAGSPDGAHTYRGPGRILVFSAGARGFGEGFVSVYLDSDKIAAAPGIIFRRSDALEAWCDDEAPAVAQGETAADLLTAVAEDPALGKRLGARMWAASLRELGPGETDGPFRYEWCREEYSLVISGAPTLRHAGGEQQLSAGDIMCFPQGPDGARQLRHAGSEPVRVVAFSTPADGPMSAFYPDDDMAEIRVSNHEGFRFRLADQIDDYWDGEPGAGAA
jgi:uncharacterized cupin superfamily protein